MCVILTPSPCIYRREPPAIRPRTNLNLLGGPIAPRHVSSERRWGSWAATTGLGDLRSADRGLGMFGLVFGQMAARWAPMSCIWVRACLESVW